MPAGRPLAFDPDQALDRAMELFWSRGYEATSLRDLLAAMALSRSSFYQTFGGKQQLFERCLQRYRERMTARMLASLEAAPSGLDFIRSLLRSVLDEARGEAPPRGCLVMNTASELGGREPAIAARVTAAVESFTRVFAAALERTRAEGALAPASDTAALASYLVTSMSGLRTMAKAGAAPQTLEHVIDIVVATVR